MDGEDGDGVEEGEGGGRPLQLQQISLHRLCNRFPNLGQGVRTYGRVSELRSHCPKLGHTFLANSSFITSYSGSGKLGGRGRTIG